MGEILLEAGTNELELLIFTVGDQKFGVNIAKVLEIMQYQPVTKIPASNPAFEGVFTPRDKVISVVNLHTMLKREKPTNTDGLFLVCHFNKMDTAFLVTSVQGIKRISWEAIEKPPEIASSEATALTTGIATVDKDIILILDFERIVSEMNPAAVLDTDGIESINDVGAAEKHIVVAEDSTFLNTMIVKALGSAGYTKVSHFKNGKEAWEFISTLPDASSVIACVVTDIEMPKMDGHHLCKAIKSDDRLKKIPVYLFSSLINEQMIKKGESVGADAQFSKPQINALIDYLKGHI